MRVLSIYSIKGGVGKTSTAVNLAYLSAAAGARTLLWDLDPQGASSFYFRINPKIKGGVKKLLRGKTEIDGLIKGTDYPRLDLLPADFRYRNLSLSLEHAGHPKKRFRRMLAQLEDQYDTVFLDCPPSISLASEAVFSASDALVVPIIPTTLSLRTLSQLARFVKENSAKKLRLLVFFSMADRRKRLHLDIMKDLPARTKGMLKTVIPYASEVERMGVEQQPVCAYAPRSRSAKAYEALWQELESRKIGR